MLHAVVICQLPLSSEVRSKVATPVARKVMDYYLLGDLKAHI